METLLIINFTLVLFLLCAIYGSLKSVQQSMRELRDVGTAIVYGEQKIIKAIEDLNRNTDVKKH